MRELGQGGNGTDYYVTGRETGWHRNPLGVGMRAGFCAKASGRKVAAETCGRGNGAGDCVPRRGLEAARQTHGMWVDDVNLSSSSRAEAATMLQRMVEALYENGLDVKPSSCDIMAVGTPDMNDLLSTCGAGGR